ncbi:hypothetical protein AB0L40_12915 [Patulibacter sp. NPDC049589]|uniref:hypothetical protein n=1 Tax=Patulibacter sp. NPDC049589 TaxID=3154731 RepID=UPI00343254BD
MRASAVPRAAGLAAALLLVPAASAAAEPRAVRGGTGVLVVDPGLRRDAARGHVRIRAGGGARIGATRAVLPVRSGTVDPATAAAGTTVRGVIRWDGRRGRGKAVPWTALRVQGGRRWTLRARVPGGRSSVVVGTATAAARPRATATAVSVPAVRLRLSARGAR